MKFTRKAILPTITLIASLFFPYVIGDGQYYSANLLLECVGTIMLAAAFFITNVKVCTIFKVAGLATLALFNSYFIFCEEAYGLGAIGLAAAFMYFAAYAFLIAVEFYRGRVLVIVGSCALALNALVCVLPIVYHPTSIIECSCVLKFIALAIIWWQQTGVILLGKEVFKPEDELKHTTEVTESQLNENSGLVEKENLKMKYCQHCGAQVNEQAVVCVKCGCALTPISNEPDVASAGLNVLSFFFPLVGLILYIIFSPKTPIKAKAIGKWAIIGFVVAVCFSLFTSVAMFAL